MIGADNIFRRTQALARYALCPTFVGKVPLVRGKMPLKPQNIDKIWLWLRKPELISKYWLRKPASL